MAREGAARPPFHAVAALAAWAKDNWAELESAWIVSGNTTELIDLSARKLFIVIYGDLMRRMPDFESREDLKKKLNQSEAQASQEPATHHVVRGAPEGWRPGVDVPVPDWWDDDPWDAPPEFRVS